MQKSEKVNQCGETCERAKLCAVCAKELSAPAAPSPAPAPQPVSEPSDEELIALWGMRSDGPDNAEILSFARAVLALRPAVKAQPLTDERILEVAGCAKENPLAVVILALGHAVIAEFCKLNGIGQEGGAA